MDLPAHLTEAPLVRGFKNLAFVAILSLSRSHGFVSSSSHILYITIEETQFLSTPGNDFDNNNEPV